MVSDCATVSCSSAASWPRAPSSAATRPDSSSNIPALAFSAVRRCRSATSSAIRTRRCSASTVRRAGLHPAYRARRLDVGDGGDDRDRRTPPASRRATPPTSAPTRDRSRAGATPTRRAPSSSPPTRGRRPATAIGITRAADARLTDSTPVVVQSAERRGAGWSLVGRDVAAAEVGLGGERDRAEQRGDGALDGVQLVDDLVHRRPGPSVSASRASRCADSRSTTSDGAVSAPRSPSARAASSAASACAQRLVARRRELGDRQPRLRLLDQHFGEHDLAAAEAGGADRRRAHEHGERRLWPPSTVAHHGRPLSEPVTRAALSRAPAAPTARRARRRRPGGGPRPRRRPRSAPGRPRPSGPSRRRRWRTAGGGRQHDLGRDVDRSAACPLLQPRQLGVQLRLGRAGGLLVVGDPQQQQRHHQREQAERRIAGEPRGEDADARRADRVDGGERRARPDQRPEALRRS